MTPAGSHNPRGKQTPMFYDDVQPRWGWDVFFLRFAIEVEPRWGSCNKPKYFNLDNISIE